ncbi:MAG: hypothetical protein WCJ37_10425, partial [Syntrophus sp. (in: bacteria)]
MVMYSHAPNSIKHDDFTSIPDVDLNINGILEINTTQETPRYNFPLIGRVESTVKLAVHAKSDNTEPLVKGILAILLRMRIIGNYKRRSDAMAKIILFIAKEQKPHHCVVSSRVARNTYDEIFHECSAAVAG